MIVKVHYMLNRTVRAMFGSSWKMDLATKLAQCNLTFEVAGSNLGSNWQFMANLLTIKFRPWSINGNDLQIKKACWLGLLKKMLKQVYFLNLMHLRHFSAQVELFGMPKNSVSHNPISNKTSSLEINMERKSWKLGNK